MTAKRRFTALTAGALVLAGSILAGDARAATRLEVVADGGVPDALLDRIEVALDDAEETLGSLDQPGTVYLWTDLDGATDDYLREGGMPASERARARSILANNTAFANARFMFVSAEKIDDEYLHRAITTEWTMAHEYAHMLHQQASGDAPPVDGVLHQGPSWLLEGAADLAALSVVVDHGREVERSVVRRNIAHARNVRVPLSEMERGEDFQDADPNGDGDYAMGFVAARRLAELSSADAVLSEYWEARGDGGTWQSDFEDVFGMSAAEFSDDVGDWYAAQLGTGGIHRLAGNDRLATAVAISQSLFDDGTAPAAVLARSDSFADALAGTALAAEKTAPLLLTPPAALAPSTEAELRRALEPGATVYVLGGTGAIAPAVEERVGTLGYRVVRLAGVDRYETAVAIAERGLGSPATVFLASGTTFQDALIAGPAAARAHGAVLLTSGPTMPAATSRYLAANPGGRYAVGAPASAAAPTAVSLAGATPSATSIRVASQFDLRPIVGVASDASFADALGGGTHAALMGGPLLLTSPGLLPDDLRGDLTRWSHDILDAYVYGGTAAISAPVFALVEQIVG